jgi:hypothetical protein
MGLVEYGPEVVECLPMAAIAEGGRPASQMRGRQQRAAIHGPQSSLGAGDFGLISPQRSHEPGVQLTREPELPLIGVTGQPRSLRPCGGGG